MSVKKPKKRKYKVPEVKKRNRKRSDSLPDVFGIIIAAFGVLMFMSMYFKNTVGVFGRVIDTLFLGLLGVMGYAMPVVVILYGFFIILRKTGRLFRSGKRYLIILVILISAIIHTGFYDKTKFENAGLIKSIEILFNDGSVHIGGGVAGGLLSMPFLAIFQATGTIILLTALSIITIILLTNISISDFARSFGALIMKTIRYLTRNIQAHVKQNRIERNARRERILKAEDSIYGRDARDKAESGSVFRPTIFAGTKKTVNFKLDSEKGESARVLTGVGTSAGADMKVIPDEEPSRPAFSGDYSWQRKGHVGTTSKESADSAASEKANTAEGGKAETEVADKIESLDIRLPIKNKTNYIYPSLDLLTSITEAARDSRVVRTSAIEGARKLEETLRNFQVDAKVINVSPGPAVTRYELQPGLGVKVNRIVTLADDIALNLASGGVRIEAPIPGKAAIGIEVANAEISTVYLKDVLASADFKNHTSKLSFALGKDITGENVVANIVTMPHLLIAGATGSGKSVCINSLIISLLYKSSPDEVKLLMIDPKVVELVGYNGIPHLLIPVVTDPKKAAGALGWAVREMLNRYKLFADKGVRDIERYNEIVEEKSAAATAPSKKISTGGNNAAPPASVGDIGEGNVEATEILTYNEVSAEEEVRIPQIVIIIDELADLMMVAPNEVEDSICRLAQMARAAGIHLVIATQRPSVDVITGVIKANIPSRISFAVSSQFDSRTILDMAGAERLLGRGDMLFYPVGKSKPIRVQGSFISDKEVEKVVDFVKKQASAEYNNDIIEHINTDDQNSNQDDSTADELLNQAINLVVEAGQASVSYIQRKFKVGYSRAARIIDQMEERGIVGKFEGSKPRQVLITKIQWQEMQAK